MQDFTDIYCECGEERYVVGDEPLGDGYNICPKCSKKRFIITCPKCESLFVYKDDELKNDSWKCDVCGKANVLSESAINNEYKSCIFDELPYDIKGTLKKAEETTKKVFYPVAITVLVVFLLLFLIGGTVLKLLLD